MKINRKLLSFFSIITSSTLALTLPIVIFNNGLNKDRQIINVNNYAWTGSTTTENSSSFQFKTEDELKQTPELKDFVPKYADEFTPEEIKLFIKPQVGSPSNWFVELIEQDPQDIKKGILKFKVIQNVKQADGSYQRQEATPNASTVTPKPFASGNTIWSSEISDELSKCVLNKKYEFKWASDTEMINFFETTNNTVNDLDELMVKRNFISVDSNLPENFEVKIEEVSTTATQFGAKKIKVNFGSTSKNNKDDWVDGKIPTGAETELIVRGFKSTNGQSNEMSLKFISDNISNIEITDTTLFGDSLPDGKKTLGDLTPSQFVNVIENDEKNTKFFKMISEGQGLSISTGFAQIAYMGKVTSDSDFESTTGLTKNDYSIKKIRTIPNDLEGSLDIIYTYDAVDVYTSKKISKQEVQKFPPGTFKTSTDGNKILNFSWIPSEALPTVGSSYELVNNFKKNSSNKEYVNALTNQFFFGTTSTYEQERIVNIDYVAGSTQNGNEWLPIDSNTRDVEITITFPSWAGARYTDDEGVVQNGYQAKKVFSLEQYEVSDLKINWTLVDDFINKNPTFKFNYPSQIIAKLMLDELKDSIFFAPPNNSTYELDKIFIPDDINGTITVTLWAYTEEQSGGVTSRRSAGYFNQIFVGMKKNKDIDKSIVEYSWIPNSDVSQELLSIPIEDVTTQDVIDLYLKEIPLFANRILTESDVELNITRDYTNQEVLQVLVTILMFEQSNPSFENSQKVFSTTISGFAKNDYDSETNLKSPNDLTALISVAASATITTLLVFVLITMISNRSKLRNFDSKKEKDGKKK